MVATYITPTGFQALVDEYEQLLKVERPKMTREVAYAASLGDRSENAEYIYGKKRLRQIDKKIRFLKKTLDAAVVVDPAIDRGDKVYFGATVVLESEEGGSRTVQLVGEHETSAEHGKISYRSPVGAALMRRALDDEVTVKTPGGVRTYFISEILYR